MLFKALMESIRLPSAFMMMFVNYMEKMFTKMLNEQNGKDAQDVGNG